VRFADAILPLPPLVEVTVPVIFVYIPDATPTTLTDTVQLLPAAILPPLKDTLLLPAIAVTVPPQFPVRPLGVATTMPAGIGSLNATPLRAAVFPAGFVIMNVSEVVPFSAMFPVPNPLAIDGGPTTAVLADAVVPVPPSVEVTALVTLFFVPTVVPVTFIENVHDDPADKVAPDKLTAPAAATAVIDPPPHEPVRPLGVEITRPAGSVSVKPIPDRLCVALVF
jgi:hypothetical protein